MAYKQVEHANESELHVTSGERGAMLTRAGTLQACTPRCLVTNIITYLRQSTLSFVAIYRSGDTLCKDDQLLCPVVGTRIGILKGWK